MNTEITHPAARATYRQPATLRIAWLIARRQAVEAMRTRSMVVMVGFFLALQTVMLWVSLAPLMQGKSASTLGLASLFAEFYLLWSALMPCTLAVGVAAGVFAGDKERGALAPLLVTPASNVAIFAGKVLGSVLPALSYTLLGVILYFLEMALFFGLDKTLVVLPFALTTLILVLIPAIALFGTAVASVISSRVSTFQSAQTYTSILLMVLWFGLAGLIFTASLGLWIFAGAVLAVYILDILLIWIAAATWRREEVMAKQ